MNNYYEDLSLPLGSKIEDVKSQFRKLAHLHHPDKNPNSQDAHEKFLKIQEAYQILSSPEKKKIYDEKISLYILHQTLERCFKKNNITNTDNGTLQRNNNPKYVWVKKQEKYSEENLKRNLKGSLYAFGICLGVALIVSLILGIFDWVKEKEIQRVNRILYAYEFDIKQDFSEQKFRIGLNKLDTLLTNSNYYDARNARTALQELQSSIFIHLQLNAAQSISEKKYKLALKHLELLIQFRKDNPIYTYQLIALASKGAKHYMDAIKSWEYIDRKLGKSTFESVSQIGLLYTYHVQDYDKGLEALLRARKYAIKLYQQIFGNGFVLVFNPKRLPNLKNHFNVFYALSLCYYHLDIPKQALNILTWVDRLGINRGDYFLLKGLVLQKKNIKNGNNKKNKTSCQYILKAKKLGNKLADSYIKQYCM